MLTVAARRRSPYRSSSVRRSKYNEIIRSSIEVSVRITDKYFVHKRHVLGDHCIQSADERVCNKSSTDARSHLFITGRYTETIVGDREVAVERMRRVIFLE